MSKTGTSYKFYYDESGHSRKLTENTLKADNYDDFFVSVIVGISEKDIDYFKEEYKLFEEKYKSFYSVKELKSVVLSDKKYKFGFRTFKKDDLAMINDFFDLIIKYNLLIYISIQNKINYLVNQLLKNYRNSLLIDADAIRYTVTKAISIYRPKDLITSIYQKNSFAKELRTFLEGRVLLNGNSKLKEKENSAFQEALLLIDESKELSFVDWDYHPSFEGFSLFLKEHHIFTAEIIIDEEGSGQTLKAAIDCGFKKSYQRKSDDEMGVRIADILAGLINGFLKSLISATKYNDENIKKKLLDNQWFKLNGSQFNCYNKMYQIIIMQNNSWFKTYCTDYSDPFLYLICLLNYIEQNGLDYLKKNADVNNEYLNTYVCMCLNDRFSFIHSKLKIEPAVIVDDYFVNQRGAKEYLTKEKRKSFVLQEGEIKKIYVLSAGIFHQTNTPTITILENGKPQAYDLPQELYEWALTLVGFANMGEKLLPAFVTFINMNGKYYADIE